VELRPIRQLALAALVAIGVVLVTMQPAMAQDSSIEVTPVIDSTTVVATAPTAVADPSQMTSDAATPKGESSPGKRPAWILPIHILSIAVQGLDTHSTFAVLKNHSVDLSPLNRHVTGNKVSFLAVKAGITAAVVCATDRLAKRHRIGAVVAAAAVNSAYLTIAATNYRSARATQARFGR
jgi:hypothetical protein